MGRILPNLLSNLGTGGVAKNPGNPSGVPSASQGIEFRKSFRQRVA